MRNLAITAAARASRQGSILAETLIGLPAVTAIFASVLALSAMYSAKLEAKAAARRLAWLQADSGSCLSTACEDGSCRELERDVQTSLAASSGSEHHALELDSFLGDVKRFFLSGITRGVAHVQARLPRWFALDTTSQSGVSALLCNTTARRDPNGESVLDHACRTGLNETEYAHEICR